MTDRSCEAARESMAGAWLAELEPAAEAELRHHLEGCPECAAEMAALSAMWERLGDLPVPEPSAALRQRWERTLGQFTQQERPPRRWTFWPANPVWQMAVAALCLAVGLGAGAWFEHGRGERDEVAALREEVAGTKQMVALSLLRQQSATDRLQGVDYSAQLSSLQPQIVAALIDTVNRDSSVNVRLAAIDALSRVAGDTRVRASLQTALTQQDSPMVQAALIDYLVDARERNAVGVMRDLVARPDLNPTVRERATYAVTQLAR